MTSDELAAVCPITGQPDLYTAVDRVPARGALPRVEVAQALPRDLPERGRLLRGAGGRRSGDDVAAALELPADRVHRRADPERPRRDHDHGVDLEVGFAVIARDGYELRGHGGGCRSTPTIRDEAHAVAIDRAVSRFLSRTREDRATMQRSVRAPASRRACPSADARTLVTAAPRVSGIVLLRRRPLRRRSVFRTYAPAGRRAGASSAEASPPPARRPATRPPATVASADPDERHRTSRSIAPSSCRIQPEVDRVGAGLRGDNIAGARLRRSSARG